MAGRRLLILGGTAEAAALAGRLAGRPGLAVVTSLAGRTRRPRALPGAVRVGGFGGADGLSRFLAEDAIDLVVDATHPFAAAISAHAVAACARAGVPRFAVVRPPWRREPGDRWIEVASHADAAAALPCLAGPGGGVFLSVGRREIGAYAGLDGLRVVVRLIEPPAAPLPLAAEVVIGRGPFDEAAERRLLEDHRIAVVVSKESGGAATYAKIAAARALALPVVLVRRPPPPPGETGGVDDALAWVAARIG